MALKPAADENVPGIGEELVDCWALSPFLDSFSVCLWDVRRRHGQCQPHPRVNTSGALGRLTFSLFLYLTSLSFTGSPSSSELCPSATSTSPLTSQTSPSSMPPALPDFSWRTHKASLSTLVSFNWKMIELQRGSNYGKMVDPRNQKKIARKFR